MNSNRRTARPQRTHRRRGSAYVFFLGTAMLVTVIGLSAMMVMRVQQRSAGSSNDVAAARFHAQSAIEVATLAMYNDPTWRDSMPHDTWVNKQAIGDGAFTYKFVDEVNGSLSADRNAPLRVFGQGAVGEAVWICSVLVQPPLEGLPSPGPNLLVNGEMENGTKGWIGTRCDIESHMDVPHGGLAYIWVKNRNDTSGGPKQSVMSSVTSGTTYSIDIWVRTKDAPEEVTVTLWIGTSSGGQSFPLTANVGTSWTQVTGQLTPSWTGDLILADLAVGTTTSKQEFMIDDARMSEGQAPEAGALGPIPGTWRRETE